MTIIAIDGPAASGKSAIGVALAKRLGFHFLDSGLIYRAMALVFLRSQEEDFSTFLEDLQKKATIEIDHCLEDPDLHKNEIGQLASKIAVMAEVRQYANDLQHQWAKNKNGVIVGRDIGTVVFPDAPIKFYVTASLMVRAMRRWQQLTAQGFHAEMAQIQKDLFLRDERDQNREHAPMQIASHAIVIDTSDLSINQVVDLMEERVKEVL